MSVNRGRWPGLSRRGWATVGSIVLTMLVVTGAQAQTVYTYTGDTFTTADPPYTTSDRLNGAFSVVLPIEPLTPPTPADVLDFSFSDGVVTLTPANAFICRFDIGTDAAGHIIDWSISLREAVFNPGDPQQFMDSNPLLDQAGIATATGDACGTVTVTTVAQVTTEGAWTDTLPPGTPTTYSFTGAPFTTADPPYTTSHSVTGSFQVADPLPDFQARTEIGFALETFSFSDGVQTRTPANSEVCSFQVATDGAGHVVAWRISLREPGIMPGNPQQTMDVATDGDLVGSGMAGATTCEVISLTTAASNATGGTWTDPLPPGEPIRYTYTGEPYSTAQPPYTTADRVLGSVDLPNELPPFLPLSDISFALADFAFHDGVQTRTLANSVVCRFEVATDGTGNVIDWRIGLRQPVFTAGDPQQIIDSSPAGDSVGTGPADTTTCGVVSLTTAASNMVAGTWNAPLPPAIATEYIYEGDPATTASAPYTLGDSANGAISVAGRLLANLPLTDIRASLLAFSFMDGQETREQANTAVCNFEVATDANGAIVQWRLTLRETGVAPGDPQHSVDVASVGTATGDLFGFGPASTDPCGMTIVDPFASVDTPGTWIGQIPVGPEAIPTVSELAARLLVVLLALAGLTVLRRSV